MYPRTEYEMTEEDLQGLLQPRMPEMLIGGHSTGAMQQDTANNAWKRLGDKMGFDWETVQPARGKGQRFFTAIPSETLEAKAEREAQQADDKRKADIDRLQDEIYDREQQLNKLLAEETH